MIQRGKKAGGAKLASVVSLAPKPPEPIEGLTKEEAAIWRATVSTEDPGFFASGAQKAMLSDYCRHRAAIDKITRVVNLFEDDWLKSGDGAKRYAALLSTREKETRAAADKATKLRLTNQSRYLPQTAARAGRDAAAKVSMPWDDL